MLKLLDYRSTETDRTDLADTPRRNTDGTRLSDLKLTRPTPRHAGTGRRRRK
jgi:hypothetical protein